MTKITRNLKIMKNIRQMKKQLGQGMTEYIIIVALIAIAAIAAYGFFGETLRSQVGGMAEELAGNDGSTAVGTAQKAAGSAVKEGEDQKRLDSYTGGNK